MKFLKSLLILTMVITFANCSESDSAPIYPLSYENIAGTYNVQSFSYKTDVIATTNGIPITIATASAVGDTFQIDLTLNVDGTYTIQGAYRVEIRLVPVVGNAVETQEIINISNTGTFTLNTNNNTITFSDGLVKDLNGTLEVRTFNETSFSLFQETDLNVSNNVENIETSIAFVRN